MPTNLLIWYFKYVPSRMNLYFRKIFAGVFNFFSPKQLLTSLFMPWKKDEQYLSNPSLAERFNLLIFNLLSRLVGFSIRSLAIFAVVILIIAIILIVISSYLLWFSLPMLSILSFIKGWLILR